MKIKKRNLNKLIRNYLLESSDTKLIDRIIKAKVIEPNEKVFYVSGAKQMFYLFEGGALVKKGKVSTGANGFGNEADSGKTATGLMRVAGIVGNGLKRGTVLVGLSPTNPPIVLGDREKGPRKGHAAEVLTRAITLQGLENKNKNVNARSIYIHGTNREQYLGKAKSGGCVRVSNDDVIELAENLLSRGDKVYIDPGGVIDYDPVQDSFVDKATEFLGLNEIKVGDKEATPEEALEILKKYPPSKNA